MSNSGIIWFLFAHVCDYISTVIGLLTSKIEEGNPIIVYFINKYGVTSGLLYFKVIMVSFILVGVYIISRVNKKSPNIILWFSTIVTMIAVVIWIVLLGKEIYDV